MSSKPSTPDPSAAAKRKADEMARGAQPYSQPALSGTGIVIETNIHFTVEWLKKRKSATWEEIRTYLNTQNLQAEYVDELRRRLKSSAAQIQYDPSGAGGKGTFAFKPKINVRSTEDLLAYLQRKETSEGTLVKDLKEGWPEAIDEIRRLAAEGKVLVTLNKKDETPRQVWRNDPTLSHQIDEQFQKLWMDQKLPATKDDLRKALLNDGLTPTSQVKKPLLTAKKEKKKVVRRGGKTMNTHMAGMLKDYSHLRK